MSTATRRSESKSRTSDSAACDGNTPVTMPNLEKFFDSFLQKKLGPLLDSKLAPLILQISDLDDRLSGKINDLEMKISNMETNLEEKNTQIEQLNERIHKLEAADKVSSEKLLHVQDLYDSHEADTLCDNIFISGPKLPAVTTSEDTAELAANLLRNCTRLTVDPTQILSAYRTGKKRTDGGPDTRPIKLRLKSRSFKHEIVRSCVTLRNGSSKGLFLNEELTKHRNNIYFKLRKMKKESCPNLTVYTRDGAIKARISSNGKTFTVNTESQYQIFLQQTGLSPIPQ